jgi:hypothetical protein
MDVEAYKMGGFMPAMAAPKTLADRASGHTCSLTGDNRVSSTILGELNEVKRAGREGTKGRLFKLPIVVKVSAQCSHFIACSLFLFSLL